MNPIYLNIYLIGVVVFALIDSQFFRKKPHAKYASIALWKKNLTSAMVCLLWPLFLMGLLIAASAAIIHFVMGTAENDS